MRKIILILTTILLLVSIVSCSTNQKDNPSSNMSDDTQKAEAILKVKVIKLYEKSMLVASMEENAISSDLYTLSTELVKNKNVLEQGAIIEIGYDGTIMETYPARFGNIRYIKLIEKNDDLVGLYESVLTNLWETDEGLNTDIDIIAFDLTKVSNLTDTEKSALTYVMGNKYKLETITGTFDELSEQGYIDKDNLYFENGILFSINILEKSSKSFKFDVKKWRSGLGAYFFNDCIAKKTNKGWVYEIGGEAIS